MKIFIEGNYVVVTDDSNNELYDSPASLTQYEPTNTANILRLYCNSTEFEGGKAIELDSTAITDENGDPLTGGLITWLRTNTGFNAASGGSGAGSTALTVESDITTNTTISGTQKGLHTIYPVNSSSAVEITVNKGTYAPEDVVIFSRKGTGTVNIERGTDIRLKGARNINNQFFINDIGGYAAIVFEYLDGSTLVGHVTGDITRGYTGAVTTSSYGTLREGDTAVDVAVVGTGFSENMLVTVSANATQSSAFTYNSSTSITLHLTAVGVETDTITVTYDNGDVFTDTDAITIAPASATELYNNYAFEYGWALFRLKSGQTYGAKVRRSSDNATTDVGFNGSGKIALDSSVSAGGDLTTWASTDDVFIETLYNQGSVAGFDLTQVTTGSQPKLLSAGALITQSTVTMMEYDGTDDVLTTSDTDAWADGYWSMFCNGNTQTATNGNLIGWQDSTATNRMPVLRFNTTPAIQAFHPNDAGTQDGLLSGTLSTGTNYKAVTLSNATGTALYVDGSSVDTGLAPSTTPTDVQPFEMGASSENSIFLDGYMNYAVVYKSDQEANISAIETIIDSYL